MKHLWLWLLLGAAVTAHGQARRALALMEKARYDEARELLGRALEKDSLAPAVRLVLARLYFTPEYTGYQIDSAYRYVLSARQAYEASEPKEQEKLDKSGLGREALATLQLAIEQAGFERAREQNTEAAYNAYLQQFAGSPFLDSATVLRNRVAFARARKAHTWQAYRHFLDKYPEAAEVAEARQHYEKLLYEDKTRDGRLASYRAFLQAYPATPYRQEAEKHIYNILTGRNTPAALQAFREEFPHSVWQPRALLRLYTLLPPAGQDSLLLHPRFPSSWRDSIRHMAGLSQKLVVPVYEQGRFALIDTAGLSLLSYLPALSTADKCGRQLPGLVLAGRLLALDSSVLSRDSLLAVTAAGAGLLRLRHPRGYYFITTFGLRENPHAFEYATLAGRYLAFRSGSKWGLESVTGISLLPPVYDTLAAFHDLLILARHGRWGLAEQPALYPLLDGEPVPLPLPYDSLAPADSLHLLVWQGDSLGLADYRGRMVVPPALQQIELVEGGYFLDREDSVLDSRLGPVWYRDIYRNDTWALGFGDTLVQVYYRGRPLLTTSDARTAGSSAVILRYQDTLYAYFTDTARIVLGEKDVLLPANRMDARSRPRHYIHIDGESGRRKVYHTSGREVATGRFDKLADLGEHFLLSRVRRSYRLLDDSGRVLLDRLEAAVSLGQGCLTYLREGKFGLFCPFDSVHLAPAYERPLNRFSDTVFVFSHGGLYGLVGRSDTVLVPPLYKEIRPLSDSLAALNHQFRWQFWHLDKGLLLDNINDYWVYPCGERSYYKVRKGAGYGIWEPSAGLILNPTFDDIRIWQRQEQILFVAEKWVEEADLVVLLYYNHRGRLLRKAVLSGREYEQAVCPRDSE